MDPPESNREMIDKLALPFSLLSDPEGELAGRYGVWNEDEGVAEPAIFVLDRSGAVRYEYSGGRDFSDRPAEDEVLRALDEGGAAGGPPSGEPEVRAGAEEAEERTVRPERPPMSLDQLRPYYLGAYFTSVALGKRLGDNESGRKVDEYRELVERHSDAVRKTMKVKESGG